MNAFACAAALAAALSAAGWVHAEPGGRSPLPDVEPYRAAAIERWEDEIRALEERDAAENHPAGSILFIGSSSIRRWETITTDMAPYHAIRRGYGGAEFSDLAIFAERLTTPHPFRALVIFVANDITGSAGDKQPGAVADLLAHVVATVRSHRPEVPIFYVAVTPTPARFAAWPAIRAANRACAELCASEANLHFIPTESAYLNQQGEPRDDLFVEDRLHLNEQGYALWSAIIKSHLDGVLGGATAAPGGPP